MYERRLVMVANLVLVSTTKSLVFQHESHWFQNAFGIFFHFGKLFHFWILYFPIFWNLIFQVLSDSDLWFFGLIWIPFNSSNINQPADVAILEQENESTPCMNTRTRCTKSIEPLNFYRIYPGYINGHLKSGAGITIRLWNKPF